MSIPTTNTIPTIDPFSAIRRIETLMLTMKMSPSTKSNDYQHGIMDGLGNALAILQDEIKAQNPQERALTPPPNEVPWETWWDSAQSPKVLTAIEENREQECI